MRMRSLIRAVVGALSATGLVLLLAAPAATPGPPSTLAPLSVGVPRADRAAPITPLLPDPQRPMRPEVSYAALHERLETLLGHPQVATGGTVAVSVRDHRGRVIVAREPDTPLLPASTEKLVTAAAALLLLGEDHRYTTTTVADAPPDADGVLRGNLVIMGSGDPALATPAFGTRVLPERPRTPLEALADQLVARGLRVITGGVVGDPSVFAEEPRPQGWPRRYLRTFEGTPVSGLTVDAGRAITEQDDRLRADRTDDPAATTAAALRALLVERGVEVRGGHTSRRHDVPPPAQLAAVDSPPLDALLRHTLQTSDNHMADAIFRTLGVAVGDPTWAGAAAAARSALTPVGLDWRGIVLADGSGLSRDDRLSARFLTDLSTWMYRSGYREQWESFMAVAATTGTLRRRLSDTVAAGRLVGKTGTLRDVRALSGSVMGPDGRRLHLSVIGNGLRPIDTATVQRLQDLIALVLVEHLYDCVRQPLPEPTTGPVGDDTPTPTPAAAPTGPPPPGADPGRLVCAS